GGASHSGHLIVVRWSSGSTTGRPKGSMACHRATIVCPQVDIGPARSTTSRKQVGSARAERCRDPQRIPSIKGGTHYGRTERARTRNGTREEERHSLSERERRGSPGARWSAGRGDRAPAPHRAGRRTATRAAVGRRSDQDLSLPG